MTPTTTLVFGAVAILVVVAWFVFGVIDGTRTEPDRDPRTDAGTPTRHTRGPAREKPSGGMARPSGAGAGTPPPNG